uniref:Uncharacterized protein n=1 Tax=Glossina pallidipes TaxID=7398 RepID=A0A1A9ZWB4_GLOPL
MEQENYLIFYETELFKTLQADLAKLILHKLTVGKIVDNYQSHEGELYCLVHFKLIFAPKFVEYNETEEPCKPELIIRENQPTELPPDVFRGKYKKENIRKSTDNSTCNFNSASDKPNLGLQELQQLNVRSRFHIFEKAEHTDNRLVNAMKNGNDLILKCGASITTKIKRLQQQGSSVIEEDFAILAGGSKNEGQDRVHESDIVNKSVTDNEKRRNTRTDLDDAINDLKTRFELGNGISKEERREERKQEIQNIRSRLFMGKQARIKEMYQQAVIESEHVSNGITNLDRSQFEQVANFQTYFLRLSGCLFEFVSLIGTPTDIEWLSTVGILDKYRIVTNSICNEDLNIFIIIVVVAVGRYPSVPEPIEATASFRETDCKEAFNHDRRTVIEDEY